MKNFDRQYRLAAGPSGGTGFEIGKTTPQHPTALHISFTVEKADTETPNTAVIILWNLNPQNLAILNQKNCVVSLRAGYGSNMTLICAGGVSFVETSMDIGDRQTRIEVVDGMIELRDTYVSLSYSGTINTRTIIEHIAKAMGITLSVSYNALFTDLSGFSYVGAGKTALDKACASSNLSWQIQNGILQVKNRNDTMSREVFLLSPETGLLGIPKKITFASEEDNGAEESGWEIEYFLNGAVGIGDYIRLESRIARGYFRMRSVEIEGDNLGGTWKCTARIIQA